MSYRCSHHGRSLCLECPESPQYTVLVPGRDGPEEVALAPTEPQASKGQMLFSREMIESAIDPSIPEGEIHLRDNKGRTIGKIINVGSEVESLVLELGTEVGPEPDAMIPCCSYGGSKETTRHTSLCKARSIMGIDPAAPERDFTMFSGPLVRVGLDRSGDYLSEEVLRKMMREAQPIVKRGELLAMENFKKEIASIQGTVEDLYIRSHDPFSIGCSVKIANNSPAGGRLVAILKANRKCLEDGELRVIEMEPALMGSGKPVMENGVRTYEELKMLGVSIIRKKDKVQ